MPGRRGPVSSRPGTWLLTLLACGLAACADQTSPAPNHPNHPPVVTEAARASPQVVCPGQSSTLSLLVQDPDDDDLTVTWKASAGTVEDDGPMAPWTAPEEPGTYSVHAEVTDGKGGKVSSDANVEVRNGTLLALTSEGVAALGLDGTWWLAVPTYFEGLEVWEGRAYVQGSHSMCALDFAAGAVDCGPSGEYPVAAGHVALGSQSSTTFLPDGGLGIIWNERDSVAVWKASGLWKSFGIREDVFDHLQSVDGTVVGRRFLACCSNGGDIISIDLVDGTFLRYSPLGLDWGTALAQGRFVFSVTYGGGHLFYGVSSAVIGSTDSGPRDLFSTAPDYHVTGMVVMGRYVYATVNHAGKIYRADLSSGVSEVFAQGLPYPTEIVCLPGTVPAR